MGRTSVGSALLMLAACSRNEPDPPSPAPPLPVPRQAPTTLSGTVDREAKDATPPLMAPTSQPRTLAGKKVLHVGDSMVGGSFGLTRALEAKLGDQGATIIRHTKVSESLASFDKSQAIKDLLRTHDPDIVIINLGSNDTLAPFPSGYAHNVESIAKRVVEDRGRRPNGRECWWIGPPSWKGPDTGIVSVIRDNASRCHFFDSSKLDLERATDGVHPNDHGAAKWAEAFWEVFRDAPG